MAEFIGTMNFFDGDVKSFADGFAFIDAGAHGDLQVPIADHAFTRGASVTVAVRPEKIRVDWQRPGQVVNALAGRIDAEAYLGDRSHYFVEVPGLDRRIAVALQNGDRASDRSDVRGREVWLTWPAEAAVLLQRS